MNKIHRNVWNTRRNAFVVVAENTRSCGKAGGASSVGGASGALLAAVLLAGGAQAQALATPPPTLASTALPSQPNVVAGAARIATQGSAMTVTQSTERAAINWQSFNIGRDASVQFVQPGASSVTLNRVTGNEGSVIDGALRANGQVFLLNPNGVLFNAGARVDTAGLLASSLNITDADFMAGRANLSKTGTVGGAVINRGTINSTDGGYVALIGAQVKNDGVITATLGNVTLAAGNQATLNFNGNSLVGVVLSEGALDSLVANGGAIRADGGQVLLTAKAASGLLDGAVNNTGEVRARTIANHQGRIVLLGDMASGSATVGGTLDASAPEGGHGGFIETSAATVKVQDGARVTTQASKGQTGTWLIDPNDYTIAASGGNITGAALGTNLDANNVQIATATQGTGGGNGDIFVNDAVSWTSNNTLTLTAERNININQNVTATGASGKLALEYGQGAVAAANTADYNIGKNITVSLKDGANFSTLLGSDGSTAAYTVISSATDVQNMNNGLNGRYALGANVNLANISNFTPVGNAGVSSSLQFVGMFAGLGHAVSNLTVDSTANVDTYSSGLFGDVRYAGIRDVRIVGASVTNNKLYGTVGALVGFARDSQIKNVDVSASTLTATPTLTSLTANLAWNRKPNVGGLAGWLRDSVLTNSSANTVVVSTGSSGGLVSTIQGGATASVRSSYSGGQVTGALIAGGLIGEYIADGSTISDVYSTANVTVTQATNVLGAAPAGGLIGRFGSGGSSLMTITNAYASGLVSGPAGAALGGVLGNMYFSGAGAVLNNLFYDTQTTGRSDGIGLNTGGSVVGAVPTGIANANAYTQANYSGFDFTSSGAWFSVDGYTRPFLRMEATTAISNAHELQLMSMNLAGKYTLLNNINLAPSLANKSEMWKDRNGVVDYSSYQGSWTPVGNAANPFAGTFDGLDRTIDRLAINISSSTTISKIGLFGDVGATGGLNNIGLTNAAITLTGTGIGNNGVGQVGVLAGKVRGSVSNAYATGTITVTSMASANNKAAIGGLIGELYDLNGAAALTNSHADVAVSAVGFDQVGGLVGAAFSSIISNTYAKGAVNGHSNVGGLVGSAINTNGIGSIVRSFATGAVSGLQKYVGGLVGFSYFTIDNSYATGDVSTSGTGSYGAVGGLVGNSNKTITNSYSTGAVSTSWTITTADDFYNSHGYVKGAFVGAIYDNGPITNSFYNSSVNAGAGVGFKYDASTYPADNLGYTLVNSLTGKTTAEMKTLPTFAGATPAWDVVTDPSLTNVYPQLRWATTGLNAGSSVWVMAVPTTPVVYSLSNLNTGYTYSGAAYNLSSLWTPTSIFGGSYNAWVLGTDYTFQYGGNAVTAFTNAGTYAGLSVNVIKTGFAAAGSGNTTGSFTIDPKALSLTATKVYDGSTALSGAQVAFSGMVNTETLTYTGATANSKNVGTGNFVAAITLANGTNGGLASNYALPTLNAANAIAAITAQALTATASAPNKVYNGNTTAAPTLTITAGLVGSETLNATGTGTFDSKDVTTASTVTVNSTALADGSNGGLASNYSLAAGQTAAASITPAAVNASAVAANKVYNGDTTAAVTLTITGGLVGSETLTATGAATFNTKDVATANTVTVNSTALADGSNGGLASNYQLTVTNPTGLSATITARPVTVSTYSSAQKVYDGSTALDSDRMALGNLAGGDNVTLSGSGVLADKNVGTRALTGVGSLALDDSNYTLVGATLSGTANVAPLLVEVAAINGASRVYNGSTAVAASLLQINNIVSGDSVALSGSVPMSAKDAGTRTLRSVSGLAINNSNYTLAEGRVTGSVEVTALPLNISTITGASRVYDTSTNADASLLQATNVFSGDSLTLSGSSVLASKDVGSRVVTGVGSLAVSNSNYTLVGSSLAGAVAISPRPVTVNAYNNAQKVYDGSTALDSNMMALGNLLGDSVALSGSGVLASKDVGNPALTGVGSLALDNNNFTLVGATLGGVAMVLPRMVDIGAVNGASRVYDGTTAVDASLLQITNIASGDSVALSGNATAASKNVGTRAIADLAGLSLDNSNYTLLEATTPAAVVITARPVTVTTYSSAQKVYDGSTALDSDRMALGNLAGGDNVTLSGSGVLADKNVGTRALTGVGSLALDDSNYTLVGATLSGTANVAPLLVEVAAINGASRVYNGSTAVAASLLQINNIVSGDSVALSGSVPMSAKDAGTRTLRSMNGLSIDNSNYTLAEGRVTGSVQVTALPLNVSTVTGASRVYDGSTAADSSLLQITNAVAGDAVGLTGSGVLAGRNVGNQAVATGSLALIDANGNYTWTSAPSGTVAVIPRSVTVSAVSGATKVYDRNTDAAASLLSVGGVLPGDTATLSGSATLASARVGNQALGLGSLALSNANYALPTAAPTGTVAITPRTLQITVSVADKVFDGSAQVSPSFGDNRITGDQLAVQGSAAFADQNAGSAKPVAMSNLGLSGADAGNYALASNAGQGVTGNLAPKPINYTLTASDPTKRYTASGATLVSTAQLDQLVLQSWAGTVAGTPAGQLSYAIYKAGQPVAEIKEAGVYEIRASFASADAHYAIDTAASQPLTVVVSEEGAIQATIAQAQRSATLPTVQLASVNAPLFTGEAAAAVPNVMTPSVQLTQSFGNDTPLMVLSAPNGDEPSSSVTLEQARRMLASSTATPQGGGGEGSREVRVPVSRNSLAAIVNGGVKLPTGVDQLLFVVKAQ